MTANLNWFVRFNSVPESSGKLPRRYLKKHNHDATREHFSLKVTVELRTGRWQVQFSGRWAPSPAQQEPSWAPAQHFIPGTCRHRDGALGCGGPGGGHTVTTPGTGTQRARGGEPEIFKLKLSRVTESRVTTTT